MKSLQVLLAFSFLLVGGCGAEMTETQNETEVDSSAEEALTGAPSNFAYYVVTRPDYRRCKFPLCGGWFVKRVNLPKTRCADGALEPECYVSSIELNGVGLSQRQEAELRASVESGRTLIKARTFRIDFPGAPIGMLKASEAWDGMTGSPAEGTFFRLADNGIRCIAAPCPSTTAYVLNTRDRHDIIDVAFQTHTIANEDDVSRAAKALATKEGILVAGNAVSPVCIPGSDCGPNVVASEFYLRVTRRDSEADSAR